MRSCTGATQIRFRRICRGVFVRNRSHLVLASIRKRPIFVTRVTPKVRKREHHIVDFTAYPEARVEGSTNENEHQHYASFIHPLCIF